MTLYMRFPGGKSKALTLSYDDGVEQDMRLMDIMRKHGLKGTFNISSGLYMPEGTVFPEGQIHRRMSRSQVDALYPGSGMEVAVHTLTHPHLVQIPVELCTREVIRDRENLEAQFGTMVRGMAYPYGRYDDRVVQCLRDCGIAYARTTQSTGKFDMPADWLRLAATCHHDDPNLMGLAQTFVEMKVRFGPQMFYLWGHSYEFERNDNWSVIEAFAAYMGGREEIWYATNIEIYDYAKAYESLQFTADGRRVFNPTCREVYFCVDNQNYGVKPGETLTVHPYR